MKNLSMALFVPIAALWLASPSGAQNILYQQSLQPAGSYGWSVDDAGDVNGDGVSDVLIGAPHAPFQGLITGMFRVLSGQNGSTLYEKWGESHGDQLGTAVCGLGDTNADGFGDFAVAAPWDSTFLPFDGSVRVYSGADGLLLAFLVGTSVSGLFGYSLDGGGDVDGDGVGELAVSQSYSSAPRIQVYSGATIGLLLEIPAPTIIFDIELVPDATGDGTADISALLYNSGVSLYSGADGSQVQTWTSTGIESIGSVDIDGDGIWELLLGNGGANQIEIRSGVTGAVLSVISGAPNQALGRFPTFSPGDLTGDGIPEIAGRTYSPPGSMLRFYSGADGTELPAYAFSGGSDLAGAGLYDLNSDGLADYVVGDPGPSKATVVLGGLKAESIYCTAKVNSTGCVPAIDFTGAPSLSVGDNFVIRAKNELPGQVAIMIWSLTAAAIPFYDATLCLGAPVNRSPGQVTAGSDLCGGTYAFPFTLADMQQAGLTAGLDIHSQIWSRDTGYSAPKNFNLTNALKFTILQ